mgnify:CR=1 FL=1
MAVELHLERGVYSSLPRPRRLADSRPVGRGERDTIAFDEIVHNTLWMVGHLLHMALLNIGLLVIGATYAFLPELTGKPL